MALVLNLLFGLVPTLALAWSVAADERKPEAERVVSSTDDRRRQTTMFLLTYGLWALTLAMWNWMRSAPAFWIVVWSLAGCVALSVFLSRRCR